MRKIEMYLLIPMFWSSVNVTKYKEDYWIWTGDDTRRYPRFDGVSTHRFSYTVSKGEIGKGLHVRHTCHNTRCVNPHHLVLGTHQDNMRDLSERLRAARGRVRRNANMKLTDAQVSAIRNDARRSESIARDYGVSGSTIRRIKLRHRRTSVEHAAVSGLH